MTLPATLLKVRFAGDPRAQELLRMQDNIGSLLNSVAAMPILSGVAVNGVVLGATAVDVSHGLGRAWTNWLVTNRNASAAVWNSSTANAVQVLTLTASGTVTVNLWVW